MIKKCTLKIEAMKNSTVVRYCGADLRAGQESLQQLKKKKE